ncbi:MAG: histidinol-phosphate transaminase [Pseudomonadota bacterium]|nr:histidinol-phosphate transaminase [Pseudomonadota bacterium]
MARPRAKPGIMAIEPYKGGLHAVEGVDEVVVLASNEGPLGASPRAIEAYQKWAKKLHHYPDGGADELRAAIGERFGYDPSRIVCGAGSDEIISLLVAAYAGIGEEIVYSEHGFLMYPINAKAVGAIPVAAVEKDLTANVDNMLALVTNRTRIMFLANPNNPTGTYMPVQELRRLHAGLPSDVLLVIDAAYAEYVSRHDYVSGAELVEEFQNVVMTRTYSKVFGLAALRLGWAYCPSHVSDVLNRLRNPFNVSAPAQAAGIAAVGDLSHTDSAIAHNDEKMPQFVDDLRDLGLQVAPSVGNFVLVRFGLEERAKSAYEYLLRQGVITRLMGGYGLPDSLRITIGLEAELKTVLDALTEHGKESL